MSFFPKTIPLSMRQTLGFLNSTVVQEIFHTPYSGLKDRFVGYVSGKFMNALSVIGPVVQNLGGEVDSFI